MKFAIEIVEYDTGNVIKSIECACEKQAEAIERAVDRKINCEKYFSRLVRK